MNTEIHEIAGRVRFKASYETQLLIKRLVELADGKDTSVIVPYQELNSICGRNVQGNARSLLGSARRIVERERHCLFSVVDGKGIRLMAPSEQVTIGDNAIQQIRRKSKRALERMALVEYDKLNADEKRQHNAQASLLGASVMFTSPAARKEIEAKVIDKPLQIGETFGMFGKK